MSSRAAQLADQIESQIAAGTIPVGTRLGTKDELRLRHDVAYGTLNEALRILQQRGFVTSRTGPGGGLFASTPTATLQLSQLVVGFREGGTYADCAVVRLALEEPVALDAARSRTPHDVADLDEIVARCAGSRTDPPAYLLANWQLHRRIAQICSNRILGNLYTTLLDASESQMREAAPHPTFAATVDENLAAHRALVAAIAAGSEEQVRAAVHYHETYFVVSNPDRPLVPAAPRPA